MATMHPPGLTGHTLCPTKGLCCATRGSATYWCLARRIPLALLASYGRGWHITMQPRPHHPNVPQHTPLTIEHLHICRLVTTNSHKHIHTLCPPSGLKHSCTTAQHLADSHTSAQQPIRTQTQPAGCCAVPTAQSHPAAQTRKTSPPPDTPFLCHKDHSMHCLEP